MRDCPKHGMLARSCDDCYYEELEGENKRLKADVQFYQQNERDHYRRAAGYVTAEYREKADRLVHENVSLRGQIAELKQEHEKQIKWREADSLYWYQRGFKAERELKEARAEVEKLRVELDKANSNRDGLSREYWHLKRKTERLMASLKGIRVWCANRIERIPLKGNEELHALAGEVYQEADGAIGFD